MNKNPVTDEVTCEAKRTCAENVNKAKRAAEASSHYLGYYQPDTTESKICLCHVNPYSKLKANTN